MLSFAMCYRSNGSTIVKNSTYWSASWIGNVKILHLYRNCEDACRGSLEKQQTDETEAENTAGYGIIVRQERLAAE